MLRHNGKLSLIILPILVLIFRLLPWKKTLSLGLIVSTLFYLTQNVLRFDILKIHFLYPSNVIQGWKADAIGERLVSKIIGLPIQFLNSLDLIRNWHDTNIWRGSWGGVANSGSYLYNGDVEAGFIRYEPLVPRLRELVDHCFTLSYELPFVFFQWNPAWLLYFFVIPCAFFWLFPRSLLFSIAILSQTVALLFFTDSTNWRYFYYQFYSCYFILPLIGLDHVANQGKIFSKRPWLIIATVLMIVVAAELLPINIVSKEILGRNLRKSALPEGPYFKSYYLPFTTPASFEYRDLRHSGSTYTFDDKGIRIDQQTQPLTVGARGLLLLGDEILFGRGLKFYDTIAGHLSLQSNSLVKPIQTFNSALTGGDAPDSYYAYFKREGMSLVPKVLVVVISPQNDLFNISQHYHGAIDENGLSTIVKSNRLALDFRGDILNLDSMPWPYRITMWSDSSLFMGIADFLSSSISGTQATIGLARRTRSESDSLNIFLSSLRGLRQLTRQQKIRLMVLLVPDIQENSEFKDPTEAIVRTLRDIKAPYLRLHGKIDPIYRHADGRAVVPINSNKIISDEILNYLREYDAKRGF
jgi:hypothetical protein